MALRANYTKFLAAGAGTLPIGSSSITLPAGELCDNSIGDTTTYDALSSAGSQTLYVLIDVATPNGGAAQAATKVTAQVSQSCIMFLDGSNDGASWVSLGTVSLTAGANTATLSATYKYYQAIIYYGSAPVNNVSDIRLYDSGSVAFLGSFASTITGISSITGISTITF